MAAVPLPLGDGGGGILPPAGDAFLLLPEPVAVLNHGGQGGANLQEEGDTIDERLRKSVNCPQTLEDACVMAYLKYLENEMVTYISLTQSKSHLVKGVAKRMIQVSSFD